MLTIRNDVPVLFSLIQQMAEYEQLPFAMSAETLAREGFGERPHFRGLIAEFDDETAGYALFFDSYSSFQGRSLFLEDLFVRPQFRKNKIGHALLTRVALIAETERCFGVILHVLDWNEIAMDFYRKMNATFLDNWKTACISGDALQVLANSADL